MGKDKKENQAQLQVEQSSEDIGDHADDNYKRIEIDRETAQKLIQHVERNLGFYPEIIITDEEDEEDDEGDIKCTIH